MRNATSFLAIGVLLLLSACDARQSAPAAGTQAPTSTEPSAQGEVMPSFVGRIWVSVTSGAPRGSIVVFLPNKTMLRDSCFETFRVSEWGIISDTRIRWREDAIPIEAEYIQPSPDELVLKPIGTNTQETYVAISVPYVCPDMPR